MDHEKRGNKKLESMRQKKKHHIENTKKKKEKMKLS